MRRSPILGTLLLIPAIAMIILVGCSKPAEVKKDKKDKDAVAADGNKDGGAAKDAADITTATTATLTGTVKLKGDAPAVVSLLEQIEKAAAVDRDFCKTGDTNDEKWLIKDGVVENVVVYVEAPSGKKFKITSEIKDAFKKDRKDIVLIDQPKCQYVPRVAGVYVDVQKVQFKNSAKVPHNVKFTPHPKAGTAKNEQMAPGTSFEHEFKKQEKPVEIECGAHGWMRGQVVTFDMPYFFVTGKDGKFEIKNLPIDEELTITMWHEVKGVVAGEKKKLSAGDNKVELSISAK